MKNSKAVFQELVDKVTLKEDPDEIRSIISILMDHVLGVSQTDILAGKVVSLTPETEQRLDQYLSRLNRHEPLQYVLGETIFYGRTFQVNPSVLIPRPETEELIRSVMQWRYSAARAKDNKPPRILDIGTGSGCIAITLHLEWAEAEVYATDVSTAALSMGVGNAELHGAKVNFVEHDILHDDIPIDSIDVIVSNPPYVTESEKNEMRPNVLAFEPRQALFVPDDDPLIFYTNIIARSKRALNRGGLLAMEINEKFGREVSSLLIDGGYTDVEISTDVSGKERVVKGLKLD